MTLYSRMTLRPWLPPILIPSPALACGDLCNYLGNIPFEIHALIFGIKVHVKITYVKITSSNRLRSSILKRHTSQKKIAQLYSSGVFYSFPVHDFKYPILNAFIVIPLSYVYT